MEGYHCDKDDSGRIVEREDAGQNVLFATATRVVKQAPFSLTLPWVGVMLFCKNDASICKSVMDLKK